MPFDPEWGAIELERVGLAAFLRVLEQKRRKPGPVGGSILRVLETAERGRYVPVDTIMEQVYGYKDGPDWATHCIRHAIRRLRWSGFPIEARMGRGYRLARTLGDIDVHLRATVRPRPERHRCSFAPNGETTASTPAGSSADTAVSDFILGCEPNHDTDDGSTLTVRIPSDLHVASVPTESQTA